MVPTAMSDTYDRCRKAFPGVDIGQMHFDERNPYSGEGIADCDAGVGVCGRIQNDEVDFWSPCLLNSIDELALMIALEALSGCSAAFGGLQEASIDVFKGFRAIDFGLTLSKKVEVRPMQNPNGANLGRSGFYQSFPANRGILPHFGSTFFNLACRQRQLRTILRSCASIFEPASAPRLRKAMVPFRSRTTVKGKPPLGFPSLRIRSRPSLPARRSG